MNSDSTTATPLPFALLLVNNKGKVTTDILQERINVLDAYLQNNNDFELCQKLDIGNQLESMKQTLFNSGDNTSLQDFITYDSHIMSYIYLYDILKGQLPNPLDHPNAEQGDNQQINDVEMNLLVQTPMNKFIFEKVLNQNGPCHEVVKRELEELKYLQRPKDTYLKTLEILQITLFHAATMAKDINNQYIQYNWFKKLLLKPGNPFSTGDIFSDIESLHLSLLNLTDNVRNMEEDDFNQDYEIDNTMIRLITAASKLDATINNVNKGRSSCSKYAWRSFLFFLVFTAGFFVVLAVIDAYKNENYLEIWEELATFILAIIATFLSW